MTHRNLALIGAGYWGRNLARNFHSLGALHTLCDLSPKILDSYGAEYVGIRKTSELDSIWHDPAITQVAIAVPAIHHYRLARTALLASKDVFVEKPLCLTEADANDLISLAKEQERILMVGHLLQYHPHVQHLQEIIARGELGELHYITSNRLNLGKIRREENALWSFAPHDISVILSLTSNRFPEQVHCFGGGFLTPSVADTTLTTLAFSGGLKAHVYVSWLHPFKEQKLTVVGAKGMVVFDDTRSWAEKLSIYRNHLSTDSIGNHTANKAVPEYPSVVEAEPLRTECQHFLDCCVNRQTPRTDGNEGLAVLRVLQAAQVSLEAAAGAVQIPS